ncbi:MAG: peptide deformylase [Gammaproteobacteria bacterium]|nr:peptide deformylase [Gammaproteobacteria bacterium]MCK5262874.1 peptide deformylase [Gammaproteobacteria bacterium]
MTVRTILRMGNPLLLQCAKEITEFNTPELNKLIRDMQDTMQAEDGAGLAAPQIGVSLRLVIFGVDHNPRYPDAETVPETILINPTITPVDETMDEAWEGCLSLPGLRGMVPRYCQIKYSGFDAQGKKIEIEASGFHARVVQHECDHLDGILYPQRMKDLKQFSYTDEPG